MAKGKIANMLLDEIKELQFVHNTKADAIRRYEEIGGMPMPSIGVTKADAPFENFGDITLVGRPSSFDPANKLNQLYPADAYTVRAPKPVQMVDKQKLKEFDKKGGFFDQVSANGGYVDEIRSNARRLSSKSEINESAFDGINQFFDWDNGVNALFLKERGISIPLEKDGSVDRFELRRLISDLSSEKKAWAESKKKELFSDEKFFISNPDRDYYTQKPKLVPYTADNLTAFMAKKSGAAKEGGMFSSGGGANRAAVLENIKSLDEAKRLKDRITNSEGMEIAAKEADALFGSTRDLLLPSYKYSASAVDDDINLALSLYNKKGAARSLSEAGFSNPSAEAVAAFDNYAKKLKTMPTEYFESKPKRTVGLGEFGAAIIPDNASDDIIKILEKNGVDIYKYTTPEQRNQIKKSLGQLSFSVAPTAASVGYSALAPEQAQASQSGVVNRKNIGDIVGEYVKEKPKIDPNPLGLPQSNEYNMESSSSTDGLLSQFNKVYDSGVTGIARGPVNSAGQYANYADKYNQWRKTLGPIDMLAPVGELPQALLDKIAYGERVTMSDKIKAMFGLL